MKQTISFLFLAVILGGCVQHTQNIQMTSQPVARENIGKTITVEGWAVNRPMGAELVGDDIHLWIDGLNAWPDGFYAGGDRGKKVRVTGTLDEDHGLPVFVSGDNTLQRHGVPVPAGTDLDKASHRFILKQAHWQLIE